jgi:peptidoglycan/LPS O-acetylase OafA/YrhL
VVVIVVVPMAMQSGSGDGPASNAIARRGWRAVNVPGPAATLRFVSARNAKTLANAFDPRANSLNALRFLFAAMVALGHCAHVAVHQKIFHVGSVVVSQVGVDGFFAISGFLITRSWLRVPDTRRYLMKRCSRILPAFWVALLVTAFVAAPLIWLGTHSGLSGFSWLGGTGAAHYALSNSLLWIRQWSIQGGLAQEGGANGSLWSLAPEFFAYLALLALGRTGLLRSRSLLVPLLGLGIMSLLLWDTVDPASFRGTLTASPLILDSLRVGLVFVAGMALCLWDRRVVMSGRLVLAALVIVLIASRLIAYELVAALPIAYIVLWLGTSLPFRRFGVRHDLSYGLYLYAWPVMQVMSVTAFVHWTAIPFTIVCIAISCALARLSWTFVEHPAMVRWGAVRPAPDAAPRLVRAG